MTVKTQRTLVAMSVALAVLVAYSVLARALAGTKSAGNAPAGTAIAQTDDDDDDLSGGALAVLLLLAIGGPVADAPPPIQGGQQCPPLTIKKVDSNTARVTREGSGGGGKPSPSEWTANLDQSSRTIKLTRDKIDGAGRLTPSEWTGKADGSFYPIKGHPTADEMAYTLDGRTLAYTARKAGQVTRAGRIAASADGRSFTRIKNGVSRVFSASNNKGIPNTGRAPKQPDGVGRLDLRVVDQDGNPVRGVRADLQSTLADGFLCESWNLTDACGVAVLPPLHMGKLTLKLTAKGFETQTLQINPADLDQPVRVVLRKM